jgi:hypothetical protein
MRSLDGEELSLKGAELLQRMGRELSLKTKGVHPRIGRSLPLEDVDMDVEEESLWNARDMSCFSSAYLNSRTDIAGYRINCSVFLPEVLQNVAKSWSLRGYLAEICRLLASLTA